MAGKIPSDAFEYYVSLGNRRSYRAVSHRYGVSKRSITKFARKDNWSNRLEAIEQKAREATEVRAAESIAGLNSRHLKSIRAIQGKALAALKEMPLKSAYDAVRSIDLGIKLERSLLGIGDEPAEFQDQPRPQPQVDLEKMKESMVAAAPAWQHRYYENIHQLQHFAMQKMLFDDFARDLVRQRPDLTLAEFFNGNLAEEFLRFTGSMMNLHNFNGGERPREASAIGLDVKDDAAP